MKRGAGTFMIWLVGWASSRPLLRQEANPPTCSWATCVPLSGRRRFNRQVVYASRAREYRAFPGTVHEPGWLSIFPPNAKHDEAAHEKRTKTRCA